MSEAKSLSRTVSLGGAVLLGLGSILGTGVFISLGLAAGIAGTHAIWALGLAALLATFNALSSAQLAANHPVSGGTYAYGYRYLNPFFGFGAGLCFLLAKSASASAAAIGLIGYGAAAMGWSGAPVNLLAGAFVLLMTGLVALGLRRANIVNAVLVGVTLLALAGLIGFVALGLGPGERQAAPDNAFYMPSFLEAAALLFVAFTGYGRIATLGEEVRAPRRTIPRAILITLGVSTALYVGVMFSALAVLGAPVFGEITNTSAAPLQAVAAALEAPWLSLAVSIAAATAMAGVLLNLILGLSRVAFAMGREGDLPAAIGKVNVQNEPLLATLLVGGVITALAVFGGLQTVWSFSAFTVLIYYAITNLCALQLSAEERLYPRVIPIAGLVGCLGLAFWVDLRVMAAGVAILAIGFLARALARR